MDPAALTATPTSSSAESNSAPSVGDVFSSLMPGVTDNGSTASVETKVDTSTGETTSVEGNLPQTANIREKNIAKAPSATPDKNADYEEYAKRRGQDEESVVVDKKTKKVVQPEAPKVGDTVAPDGEETTQESEKAKSRDYSGFSQEDAVLLQRMSNESFNKFAPELKAKRALESELAEVKKKLTDQTNPNVIIDPNGYMDTKEYQSLREESAQFDSIYKHYLSQLGAIRQGQTTWKNLTTDSAGNIVTVETPVDAMTDGIIMDMINRSSQMINNNQSRLGSIQTEWKTKQAELPRVVDNIINTHFAQKIPKDDPQVKLVNDFLAEKGQLKNPLAPLMGYFYAALQRTQQALRVYEEEAKKTKINSEIERRVEHSPRATPKGVVVDTTKIADYEEYDRRRRGDDR